MSADVAAAPLAAPWFKRARLWIGLAVVVVIGAALVGSLSEQPGRPLDPNSTHQDGSKALVRVLERFGTTVHATSSISTALRTGAHSAVVVIAPDEYSDTQLRELATRVARLVLVSPDSRAGHAIATGLEPDAKGVLYDWPVCSDPGASAAGRVALPADTQAYLPGETGATSCYGGALLTTPRLAVLGSAGLLQNQHLDDRGVAALDVNAITDSRRITSAVWLTPGADAAGPGAASIWDLFPSGAYRVFWTLLAVAALLTLWRARRLGGVVSEPLPVVVRSAEVVEGHGRLYARAGARDRAAAALRAGAVNRLGRRLGLPSGASAEQVGVALAPVVGRTPAEVVGLLNGPPPA
ncbi:MAG TPA: DUF4350 domain-containing protein, partial [Jatrophihabitans sp.]|nr:DUF4350 domain-containing protein [Jatrophihabitans sp.]